MPTATDAAPRPISLAAARRIALAAQGFGVARPGRAVTMRDVQRLIDRLAQFQIDSINVVARAHYLPLFSRLGPYDTGLLDRAFHRAPRRMFEYWGHAASLIDVTLEPALRWRMAANGADRRGWRAQVEQDHPGLIDRVLDEIATHGPIGPRDIEHHEERRRENWGWNWSAVKQACEWLFGTGQITSARRNPQFERQYALPAAVLPPAIVATPTPDHVEAIEQLVARAASALGVGSLKCLADYFRIGIAETAAAVETMVADGRLVPAMVTGWTAPVWIWHAARRPRSIRTRALISPFDSMVFERARLEALFGVDYRIEIYVPEAKRRFGYYCYLLLVDEEFWARVDLKADRAAGELQVKAAWREPSLGRHRDDGEIAGELAAELSIMADWLGLSRVVVAGRGDLAAPLAAAADSLTAPAP